MTTTVARLTCDEAGARRLLAAFDEITEIMAEGAVCSVLRDAGGQWQVAIHFAAPPDETAVRAAAAGAVGQAARALAFEQVTDADWVTQSLAGLKPVRAGRFVVHGAHDRDRIAANAIGIEIEAALAFGTGHHGTTRGCLMALDALAKRRQARRILDVGTGSGVLAIAAARIFRARVIAGDVDRQAVAAARSNARINRAAGFVTTLRAAGTQSAAIARRAPYDLIFANILLGPLTRLAVPLSRLSRAGAAVVLSGLLPEHANAALAIYRAQGLALERRLVLEGWVTLVLQKRSRPGRGDPGRCRR
jgi:ribosomal protein L11 methyltransferase